MLRREGPQKRLWDEFAAVARASFRYMEEIEGIEHCETIAIEMQHYADEDVMNYRKMRNEYKYYDQQGGFAWLVNEKINPKKLKP